MKLMAVETGPKLEKNDRGNKDNVTPTALIARGRRITFPRRPLLMGIVNVNDDSFSADGRVDADWAISRAVELVRAGADIIDVGGESARTNRAAISEDEEWRRIEPVVRAFPSMAAGAAPRDETQLFPPLLSVNTWRPGVVRRALEAGADFLNDMSALPGPENAKTCAETGAALLVMHSVGAPKVPHEHVTYRNVMEEMRMFFEQKIAEACAAGVLRDQIVIDPGLNFAKQRDDNLRVLRDLEQLSTLGRPILLPVSRKGVIGDVLGIADPRERDPGTVACLVAGVRRGAAILRVHNVDAAWLALRTLEAVS